MNRDLLPVFFLHEALVSSSGMGRDVHSGVVHPAFFFADHSVAHPPVQIALKDGFGETAVACDMPKQCKFPTLDSCQKRFLWTHEGVDLAPHPVVGLVLEVGDAGKFTHALGSKA